MPATRPLRSLLLAVLLMAGLLACVTIDVAVAQTAPTTVASDLVPDPLNLLGYTDDAPPFSSAGDGFGVFQRGEDDSIPFALLDDSAGSYPPDDLGVIGTDETGRFFGATDTENGDNSGPVTATWVFDVADVEGPLYANVDAGAMGDFEDPQDSFVFSAGFDDASPEPVLSASVDEDADRTYTLDDGDQFDLDDPLSLDGVALDDDLRTVSGALDGTGDTLTVTFTARTDGGSEAFAFDSLVITSGAPLAGDGDGEEPTCHATDVLPISAVQGEGFTSPLWNEDDPVTVTVEGAVTGTYPDLGAISVQEESGDVDRDPATSEGVWVFVGFGADFAAFERGGIVQVTGTVRERFENTQINASGGEVVACATDPVDIQPTPLDLPADAAAREALEGMLVETTQDLTVTGLFTAYEFGELGVSASGILDVPTSVYEPGSPEALALEQANAETLLYIDDRGEFGDDNDPWFGEGGQRAGDVVRAGVVGVLYYSFDDYLLEPIGEFPDIVEGDVPVADRPEPPDLRAGNDVASFNVLNYFNSFGDSAVLRGAQSQDQFEIQSAKIVDAILSLDAAVLGLIELENDYEDAYDGDPATEPSIQTLVDRLNTAAGTGTYAWIEVPEALLTSEGLGGGGLGTDAIAVGIIYQPDRAEPIGDAATFDIDALLTGEETDNNRWPLAQTFRIDDVDVTVVVNHFKSKGSTCEDTVVPDGFGDGVDDPQTGNCDLVREYAAERLLDWVRGKPTGAVTPDTLVVGDLNSYEEEDPIEYFVSRGYTDVVERYAEDAFTYKFDGRYGRLDYILGSPSTRRLIRDAAVWQINSAEPYGYLYFNEHIDRTAFASSDHDPVVVSLARPGGGRGRAGPPGPGPGRGPGGPPGRP